MIVKLQAQYYVAEKVRIGATTLPPDASRGMKTPVTSTMRLHEHELLIICGRHCAITARKGLPYYYTFSMQHTKACPCFSYSPCK